MGSVVSERRDGLLTLTLNRPEARNAISGAMSAELSAALETAADDPAVRVVVITGAGGDAFSAGVDLKERRAVGPAERAKLSYAFNRVLRQIEELPVPVVAAVNGYALGGGFELALACDLRVADERATFAFPEASLGVFPGAGGPIRLERLAGRGVAKLLVFTGRRIDAREAQRLGFVEEVAPAGALPERVAALAAELTRGSPRGLRAAKILLNHVDDMGMPAAMAFSHALRRPLDADGTYEDRLQAFARGEPPVPGGRAPAGA